MKKSVLAIILAGIASVLAINAATAADIPGGPRPYYQAAPSAYYNWGGFYGGVNLGYQWGAVSNTNTEPSGLMGGLQAGYNWQNGQFVFGGETDLNLTGADDTFAPTNSPIPGGARCGPRRHGLEQYPALRHRRSRLWLGQG